MVGRIQKSSFCSILTPLLQSAVLCSGIEDTLLQQFLLSSLSVWLQLYQGWFGLINSIILLKKSISLTMFAMKTRKDTFSAIIATIAGIKRCFVKNVNHLDLNNHWKNWVDWHLGKKKCCNIRNVHFEKKGPKVENIFLHFLITF